MTMMMMSLSRSGIESTQQKRRDVEKPSRVIWRIKKATTTSKEEEEERIITRDDFDARVFTKICIMSLVLCACVLERERDERKCPAFCVIPVVTKTGDFLSVLQKKKKKDDDDDDDNDGDLPFLLLDDDDDDDQVVLQSVAKVLATTQQKWCATTTVSSGGLCE